MDYFLGGVVRSVGRAAGGIARAASKAANTVGKIPVLGDVARAGIGAVRLGMGPAAIAIDAGSRLARGQSLGAALKGAVVGQVDAVRDQLKLAEMVAPFVPGIGTGVAAALGAANALAAGRPITEAVLAAARGASPGGAIAQAADTASIWQRARTSARHCWRPRATGCRATGARGVRRRAGTGEARAQDAAFAAAGRILPPSPYAADALSSSSAWQMARTSSAALSVAGRIMSGEQSGEPGRSRDARGCGGWRPARHRRWGTRPSVVDVARAAQPRRASVAPISMMLSAANPTGQTPVARLTTHVPRGRGTAPDLPHRGAASGSAIPEWNGDAVR